MTALALVLAAVLWPWLRERSQEEPGEGGGRHPAASRYAARFPAHAQPGPVRWERRAAQSPRGEAWGYDLFTPPVIYFDAPSGQFSVTPPPRQGPASALGIALLAVEARPYRLQLAGYIGSENAYSAALMEGAGGETILLKRGEYHEGAQVQVREIAIRQGEAAGVAGGWVERWAEVTLHDDRLGREVVLSDRTRALDPPLAILRIGDEERALAEGEGFAGENVRIFVESVRTEPPEVDVVWTYLSETGERPERRTFRPQLPAGP